VAPDGESAGALLARYYDLDLIDDPGDVDLYLALAGAGDGSVLELGAGSGRLCVPLAAAGFDVTAVDRDPDMLDRARAAWTASERTPRRRPGSLRLVEADITTLDLDARFDLVILAFNGLLLLPGREAQAAALACIARHLALAGQAVIDVWLPAPDDLVLYDGRLRLDWLRTDAQTGDRVAKLTAARYQPATGVAYVTTFFDRWSVADGALRRLSREDELHFVHPAALLDLLGHAGLASRMVAGDYSMNPLEPDSERLVITLGLI
jgi:SAM-dependent methyltransferase